MPTYEYECEECCYKFEKLQSYGDEAISTCPKCGGHTKRKIGPGSGVIGLFNADPE